MMRTLLSFFLAGMLATISGEAQQTPVDLNQAIAYFQQTWTRGEIDSFRKMPEAQAVAHEYVRTGGWIRDNWLAGTGRPSLGAYFDSLGVTHTEDMSAIVLSSLHRTLNKKELGLAKQVEGYKAYWAGISDCDTKLRAQAMATYGRFSEGDNITIYFPVDTAYGRHSAVMYNCPKPEWTFDAGKDLLVKAQIIRKYTVDDPTNVFFEVQITALNRTDTPILSEPVSVGYKKKLALYSLRIE